MSLTTRVSRLEDRIGPYDDLANLSDDELYTRLLQICRCIATHPDSSPEDRARANATVVEIEAKIAAGIVLPVPVAGI